MPTPPWYEEMTDHRLDRKGDPVDMQHRRLCSPEHQVHRLGMARKFATSNTSMISSQGLGFRVLCLGFRVYGIGYL